MLRIGLCVVLLGLFATFASAEEKPTHTTDSIDTIKKNLEDEKAVLVDVREEKEWNSGHLELAILIPLSTLGDVAGGSKVLEIDKEKVVYLHCGSGVRVLKAAGYFEALGYEVRPMKQGFKQLVKEGFEKAK